MYFSYGAYGQMLLLLKQCGYTICDYHSYSAEPRCVILRHDIDTSPEQALRMAELEASLGVHATYFILIRSDFYNPASRKSAEILQRIHSLGHEIGLHFDEAAYGTAEQPLTPDEMPDLILREADALSQLCGLPITTVSMHRPGKATLDADVQIPGMVNSYGSVFFRGFKYLSDSRCNWREPVLDIIRSGEYERLHILTHPFWYHEEDMNIESTISSFINQGNHGRYISMQDNIRALDELNLSLKL